MTRIGKLLAAILPIALHLTLPAPAVRAVGTHPLFVRNTGQTDERVVFQATMTGGTVFLTRADELVYALPTGDGRTLALKETFVAARAMTPRGTAPARCVVSSFRGSDSARWRSGQPAWGKVACGEIYPGVALELGMASGSIEKVFTIAPGGSPDAIRVVLAGMRDLALDDDGRLVVVTGAGDLRFSAPLAWQESEAGREPVEIAYALTDGGYRFEVGDYDLERTLVIDPLLASTFVGGAADEAGLAGARDAEGNVYIAGFTTSLDFPVSLGVAQGASAGEADIYIAKFNADLTERLAATYLGGSLDEEARGLAVDAQGRVYVAGNTASRDYPVSAGAYQGAHTGATAQTPYAAGGDMVISRLSADLTELQASTYLGGGAPDWCRDIAVDAAGRVFVAGFGKSSDWPCVDGYDHVFHATGGYTVNGVIARLDADLTTLEHGTYLGGAKDDFIESLALDADGDVFLTGWIISTDFPTTPGAYQTAHGGTAWYYDAFVSKLDNDLNHLLASTYLGGYCWDFAYAVAVDGEGNAYVTGHTASTAATFPVSPDAYDADYSGVGGANVGDDAFVTKLEGEGLTEVLASTYLGAENWENGWALAVDPEGGSLYVGGSTNTPGFPMSDLTEPWDDTWGGGSRYAGDGFVAKLDLGLTTLEASTFVGDAGDETVEYLLAADDGVYVMGYTQSADFPVHPDGWDTDYAGGADGYIVKLDVRLSADVTGVTDAPAQPRSAELLGVWPNPFNPHATVAFSLAEPGPVAVRVFAADGRRVAVLAERDLPAGRHELTWDGRDDAGGEVPSGTYLVRLEAGGTSETGKLILLR